MNNSQGPGASAAAMVLDPLDSVATALQELVPGQAVAVQDRAGARTTTVEARTPVPAYHKLALRDHAAGEAVIKYGEAIGRATGPILTGEHAHSHNLQSLRGEGDGHPGV